MSFFDEAQKCLEQLKAEGLISMGMNHRFVALQQVNLLHTDPGVKTRMSDFYNKSKAIEDCRHKLFDSANRLLHDEGEKVNFPVGKELIHFASSKSFNNVVGLNAYLVEDFHENFSDYIKFRSEKGHSLWVAEGCQAATNFEGICAAARELGLYHFGQLTLDEPLVAFHLRTKKSVEVLKPTWAHAFANWYFDPAPEGCHQKPAYGLARCLETGELRRKEWVVRPAQMAAAFEVTAVHLSHGVDEVKPLPDFKRLGANYWSTVDARVKKLIQTGEVDATVL